MHDSLISENYMSLFCCTFSKHHICPSFKVQRQTNKMLLAIYIDFPKFRFNFTLRRKHLLNLSSAILSDWDMSRVVCQPPKQWKKCWNHRNWTMWGIPQSGCCVGCQVGKKLKGCKRGQKRWWKRLQKGDKVAMIINLATDESSLASKTTNNVIHHQIFSLFCAFLAGGTTKMKEKKQLNWHRVFILLFSQFGLNLQMNF